LTTTVYTDKIAALEAENAILRVQAARVPLLEAELAESKQAILDLAEKLSKLSNKVEKMGVRKTSENSSMPPSTDMAKKKKKKKRSLRTTSGRKPGGQPGHKGTTLQMTDQPDHRVPLVPCFCGVCALRLDMSRAALLGRRQVVDIVPIKVETVEFQQYGILCRCGHLQVAAYPEGVDNHIQYGPYIAALTVYHNVYQYLPFNRLRDFFVHICHLPLSVGTLENIVERMADKARPIWEDLRAKLETSTQVGGDETGAKVDGKKQWIWTWQSAIITFIAISVTRGADLLTKLFPKGFPLATFCSDRWKVQMNTAAKQHQLCLAHLLRELIFLIETEKTTWANQFKELLVKAIKLKQAADQYPKDHPETIKIEQQLDALLKVTIQEKDAQKTIALLNSMIKYRAAITPFLYDKDVPFDNNASERAIRNIKVKLKVSGFFKTGQEHYCILRSIIDTTIKNHQSVFEAVAAIAAMPKPPKKEAV
jgi:transposase